MSLITNDGDKLWCVYVHISPSGKYYVGITSQKPEARWRGGKGYDYNTHFSRAIQKYGWDNFEHEVVASNIYEQEAKNFEKLLISKLKSNDPKYGYNISAGGDGATGISHYGEENPFYGHHHTEETKQLMREKHYDATGENNPFYGKTHSLETRDKIGIQRGRPVCQFDLEMNFIAEYRSAKDAANKTLIKHSMILGCCHRQVGYKTAGGYIWIFKDEVDTVSKKFMLSFIAHEKLPKPVCQLTKNMVFVKEYPSIGEASRTVGVSRTSISSAMSGRSKTAGGYIWMTPSEYQKMLNGEVPSRMDKTNQSSKIKWRRKPVNKKEACA